MKRREHLGRWRNEKAERRFRALEDELWHELCETPPAALDVDTSCGSTRVYRWQGSGPPIVFFHGMGGTSLMWVQYASALAGHDLYAVDTPGDVGRSVQRVAFADRRDMARWLDETLAALDLDRAHLVGCSYGGFLALNQAICASERVASVVLLDPPGIGRFQLARFMLWGVPVLFGSLLPGRMRRWLARRLRMPLLEDRRMVRLALIGQLNHPFRLPPPDPFSDDDLRAVSVPVVLLVGEKSEIHRPAPVVERARALIPNVDAEIVRGAGHALPISHTEVVLADLPARTELES